MELLTLLSFTTPSLMTELFHSRASFPHCISQDYTLEKLCLSEFVCSMKTQMAKIRL